MQFIGTFETGTTGQFTSASGSAQSTVKAEGSYAGLNTNNTNFLKNIYTDYGLTDIARTYAGAWFRWTGTIANGWYVMLADGAASTQWVLYTLTGSKLKITINGVTYNGTTVLSPNVWYFIQVEFYCHDSAGFAKVYINGTLDITTGTIDSKTGTDTGVRQIKWQGTNSSGGVNTYVDNCLFSSTDPNFGIKVAKSGQSVTAMDLKNLDLSSSNFFLKFHSQTDTNVTFNAGDTEKSATVSHSLGYVPAFLAYFQYGSYYYLVPSIPFAVGFDPWTYAYATTTGVTVGVKKSTPHGQVYQGYVNDGYTNIGTNDIIEAGDFSGYGGLDCGYRFTGVTVAQAATIYSATVDFRIDGRGLSGTDVKIKTWGIDEDNVGGFGSDLGKTKTTAYETQNVASGSGSYFGINVKDEVQEIVNRGGWSSGNAMGFYTFNDSSPSGAYIADLLGSAYDTFLTVLVTGSETWNFRVIIFKDKIA